MSIGSYVSPRIVVGGALEPEDAQGSRCMFMDAISSWDDV